MWIGKAKWEWLKRQAKIATDRATLALEAADRHWRERNQADARADARLQDMLRLQTRLAAAEAAIREADLLRSRVNALEMERAALLVRLLPGLKLQVPQLGRLDLSVGAPGTDFDDLGDQAGASGEHPDQIPIASTVDSATIADLIGETDGPGLQPGTVVGGRRLPDDAEDSE